MGISWSCAGMRYLCWHRLGIKSLYRKLERVLDSMSVQGAVRRGTAEKSRYIQRPSLANVALSGRE